MIPSVLLTLPPDTVRAPLAPPNPIRTAPLLVQVPPLTVALPMLPVPLPR